MNQGFDVSPAVQAIFTLYAGAHSDNEECQTLVWEPTKQWLSYLAQNKAIEITVLSTGSLCHAQSGGHMAVVYLVVNHQKVIYLTTIADRKLALSNHNLLIKSFPRRARELRKRGPMSIPGWCHMRTIPVDTDNLSQEAIENGIRRFLRNFAPAMAEVKITWLSKTTQRTICTEIYQQAKALAKNE